MIVFTLLKVHVNESLLRKQQPRPFAEISVRKASPSWKLPICSMIIEKASWKIGISSVAKTKHALDPLQLVDKMFCREN